MKYASQPALAALLAGACIVVALPAIADPGAGTDPRFAQALDAYSHGRWVEANDGFRAFTAQSPNAPLAAEAHFRRGVALNRLGRYADARAELRAFLDDYPTSGLVNLATIELALSESRLGATADAAQILRPVLPRLTDDEKRAEGAVLKILDPRFAPPPAPAAAAPLAAASASSLDTIRRLVGEVTANRPGALVDLEKVIDSQASFMDIAQLYAESDTAGPAWGLVTAKMARIYLHIGDVDRAKEAATRSLQAGAGGHPDRMQEILDRATQRATVKPNMIGVILPLTGRYKPFGDQMQDGLSLALAPADNIQLVTKDSQGDADLAVAAVEELARQGAIAIIGPVGTGEAMPAAVRAQELGIPMISLSRAEGVTQAGPYVFRNSLTNSGQGRALARYASEVMGVKRAAILAPDIPAGQEVTGPFWDGLEVSGGEVRGYETYAQDQTTFSGPLKRLIVHSADRAELKEEIEHINATITNAYIRKKKIEKLVRNAPPVIDFDVLLIPDYYKTVLQIAPALAVEDVITNGCDQREMDRIRKTTKKDDLKTVTLLGTAGWNSPDLITRGGRYVQCAVIVDGFNVTSAREPTKQFVAAFREKFNNQDPGLLHAQAYDTARMVRDIVVNRKPQTRDAFREAFGSVRKFPGATGETTIAPDREADKPLFFLTVDKTGLTELPVLISPEGIAAPPQAKAAHP